MKKGKFKCLLVCLSVVMLGVTLVACKGVDKPLDGGTEDQVVGDAIETEQNTDEVEEQEDTSSTEDTTSEVEFTDDAKDVNIHFLNIKGGECVIVEDSGKYLVIGSGGNSDKTKIVDYLKNMGVKKVDYLMLTHWHEEDAGAIPNIFDKFFVDYFFAPEHTNGEDACTELKNMMETRKILTFLPSERTEYKLNNSKFKVYNTVPNNRDSNDASLVVELINGEDRVLFMADTSASTEKLLLSKFGKVDLLKVGLHGSKLGSTDEFLQVVSPSIAVIQSDGSPDAPSNDVLTRIANKGVRVMKTWEGDVVLKSTGKGIVE